MTEVTTERVPSRGMEVQVHATVFGSGTTTPATLCRQETDSLAETASRVSGQASNYSSSNQSVCTTETAGRDSLPRYAIGILTILTAVTSVEVEANTTTVGRKARLAQARVTSSKLLLALYAIDACSWGIGTLMKYEVVSMAKDREFCYLIASVALTASETIVEFLAAAVTPWLYGCIQGVKHTSPKELVHFAFRIYFASNLFALFVFPIFGGIIYGLESTGVGTIIALGAVRTVQYALGNQLGDTAVEMAKPHWMATFTGCQLCFPGWTPLLRKRTTEDQLACFLTLSRYIYSVVLAGIYLAVRHEVRLRWAFAAILLVWNVATPWLLLRNFTSLATELPDAVSEEETSLKTLAPEPAGPSSEMKCAETVNDEGRRVRPFWRLRSEEVAFLAFVALMQGVPPQSAEALLNVILLETKSIVQAILACIAGLGLLVALMMKIYRLPEAPLESGAKLTTPPELQEESKAAYGSWMTQWLLPAISVTVLLAAGAFCTTFAGKIGIYIAMVMWLPIGPIIKLWNTAADAFLFRYDPSVVSDLAYWANFFKVAIQVPLLLVNWLMLTNTDCTDTDGAEVRAASTLLFIASGILFFMCLYFALFDSVLPRERSLHAAIEDSAAGPSSTALGTAAAQH